MEQEDSHLYDNSIPGCSEVSEWPVQVKPPFQITEIVVFRCEGPRGGVCIYLRDANNTELPFFFDRFLGRLCFGAEHEKDDSAAYIKSNSTLEREAFAAIASALQKCRPGNPFDERELSILRECLEQAKVYAGSKDIIPDFLIQKARKFL